MLRNYFIVAARQLMKNKIFSFINILGLSTGLACCLLLALYIHDELSYEKHFADYDRIYRMYTTFIKDGNEESFPRVSPPIAIDLIDELPEIETATRVVNAPEVEVHLLRHEDRVFYEKSGALVDSTFLDVFPYPLKEGNAETALDEPATMLVSERLGAKIFGDKSPLNEILIVNSGRSADTFRITGVIKETPYRSHVDYDFYLSMNSDGWGRYVMQEQTWAWNNFVGGYLKLRPGASGKAVEAKLPALLETRAGADLKNAGLKKQLGLQPLDKIRLYSDFSDSFGDTGSGGIKYVYISASIGIFILLLACINFMNLTTAKASQRASEVGIRKSMGASRMSLMRQFIGESMTIVFASLAVAVVLASLALPSVNRMAEKELSINSTNALLIVAAMAIIGLVTGLIAGSYPAFFLSAFEPAKVLKNKGLGTDGSQWLRKSLVVFQFVIAITLVSSIIIIRQQLTYMQNKPLGFQHDQVLMLPLRTDEAASKYVNLRNELKSIPGVKEVSATTSLPSTALFRDFALFPQGSSMDKAILHRVVNVDEDYFKVLDIDLIAGRDFVAEKDTFSFSYPENNIIVNEESLKVLNISLEDAIGSVVFTEYGDLRKHTIIGVVENFHQFSLHQPIVPMLFLVPAGRTQYAFAAVSLEGGNHQQTIDQMKAAWERVIHDAPFESAYLTESIRKQYASDTKVSLMLAWSTGLAILICCLGLYGLSIYVAERKVKEIGIRKVLGASVSNIVGMLSRDFIKLVLIAFVIAIPLGYYAMNRWLENFEYKIELGYAVFILAGIISFLIAWLTIGFESIRAALSNPVKALRTE